MVRVRLAALGLVAMVLVPAPGRADNTEVARQRFELGKTAYERGDYRAAIRRFEEAQRLRPSPTLTYNIARAHERLGEYQTAAELYRRYLAEAPLATNRLAVARRIAELEEAARHLGARPPLAALPPPTPAPATPTSARPSTPDTQPGPGTPSAGRGLPPLGVTVRVDIDGKGRGVATAVGATYGFARRVEVAAGGLIGDAKGFYAGATAFILRGPVRPIVLVAVPVFFLDGARPGIHGAAGLEWTIHRHFGLFATLGVAYFFNLPADYDRTILLPSVGVQGRL
jgi:tetratricopeptide (TPR) repeat protein